MKPAPEFSCPPPAGPFEDSPLMRYLLAERAEILRHKWLLSERAGSDVGFDAALIDWVRHHRKAWRARTKATALSDVHPHAA